VARIVEAMATDVQALLDGGVDAILFCNESDRPYSLEAPAEAIATMARVIAEMTPCTRCSAKRTSVSRTCIPDLVEPLNEPLPEREASRIAKRFKPW